MNVLPLLVTVMTNWQCLLHCLTVLAKGQKYVLPFWCYHSVLLPLLFQAQCLFYICHVNLLQKYICITLFYFAAFINCAKSAIMHSTQPDKARPTKTIMLLPLHPMIRHHIVINESRYEYLIFHPPHVSGYQLLINKSSHFYLDTIAYLVTYQRPILLCTCHYQEIIASFTHIICTGDILQPENNDRCSLSRLSSSHPFSIPHALIYVTIDNKH